MTLPSLDNYHLKMEKEKESVQRDKTQTKIYCTNTTNYDFILLAMISTLCPIRAPLGNFSAWQQPFWERISKGHHTDLLNLELEFTHRHTYTCMYIKSTRENTESCEHLHATDIQHGLKMQATGEGQAVFP